jgi:hypothetical protein
MVSWQVAREFLFADWRWGWDQAVPSLLRLTAGLARLIGFVSLRSLALGLALAYGIFLVISYIPRRIFDFLWNLLDRAYLPLLQYSLRSPMVVLLAAAALGWFALERAKGLWM